ncbi:hypothetical protein OHT61_32210 (plasmid) [Streptomyces sp. NBC_00178]|nr:hypothetical protein [Streptomyces sp. NBC_00178]
MQGPIDKIAHAGHWATISTLVNPEGFGVEIVGERGAQRASRASGDGDL